MVGRFVTFASLWAVIAAPSLCRVGFLTACCFPGEAAKEAPISREDCCERSEDQPLRQQSPDPRNCDSCPHLCDANFKAPEDPVHFGDFQLLTATFESSTLLSGAPFARRAFLRHPQDAFTRDLPFPLSDVPLLI